VSGIEICEPISQLCKECGELHTYYCGRTLLQRDPTDKKQACPGGTQICGDCVDVFGEFMQAAYDAQARRKEWQL
jgi:hypothetical protein